MKLFNVNDFDHHHGITGTICSISCVAKYNVSFTFIGRMNKGNYFSHYFDYKISNITLFLTIELDL